MSRSHSTVIITGASRGIGEATARRFCREGFRVIGIARSQEALDRIAVELGAAFVPCVANLSQLKEAERTVGSIFAKEGDAIDGIVLNAGVSMGKPFHKSTRSGRELEANLNYHSPAIFLQHALEKFAARTGKGRILVVSSLTALLPFPTNASYAASKAAFYHLLRSVRLEEAGKNVEFSAVLPGLTATQMSAGFDSILPRSSPKDVAAALFECWSKPQFPKIVGNLNRLAGVFGRLQPKLFDQMTGALQRWLPHE